MGLGRSAALLQEGGFSHRSLISIRSTYNSVQSETYTASPPTVAALYGIRYDPSAHGSSGPVQSSMSSYVFPAIRKCTCERFYTRRCLNADIISQDWFSRLGDSLGSVFRKMAPMVKPSVPFGCPALLILDPAPGLTPEQHIMSLIRAGQISIF